jgi:PKD repeat protein
LEILEERQLLNGSSLTESAGCNQVSSVAAALCFQGTASGGGKLSYSWTFGDGGTATGTLTPTHTYYDPGCYTATLTVSSTNGQRGQSSATVTVNDVPPTVALTGPSSGQAQVAVSFIATANSLSPAEQAAGFTYAWTFGDGSTGSGSNPTHTYSAAGNYTVSVTATDKDGGKSTPATESLAIVSQLTVSAGSNFNTYEGTSNTFNGSASGGTAPYTYSWTFGDGMAGSGTKPTHTYADNGIYQATLSVSDSGGQFASSTVLVTVANVAPTAYVSGPTTGIAGTSLAFTATATDPSSVDQAAGFTYAWNFGDGTTGSGSNPTHTYSATGNYMVSVTATDKDGGASAPATESVSIVSQLTVSAGSNFSTNEGTNNTFHGSASGGTAPYTYSWNFGDGTTGSGASPTHTYADNGSYTTTLSVTDSGGQGGTSSLVVTVANVAPTVQAGGASSGVVKNALGFTATATDPSSVDTAAGFTYSWNFGDGTTGSGAVVTHAYALDGIYTVTVTATDKDGGQGQATTVVDIYPSVTAGLDPTVNEGDTVNFLGTAVGSSSFAYHWDFGDGGTANGTLTPSHVYTEHGTYTATLTATDTVYGFAASSSIPMVVNDVPPTVTVNQPAPGFAGSPVSFSASASSPSPVDQAAGFTYKWIFGDGTTGAGATPSHTYAAGGTYMVSVTATDIDGATSAAASTTVTVQTPSTLAISAGSSFTTNEGTSNTFNGSASGGTAPYTFSWNFGDSTTGTGATPTHAYADNGAYTAKLTVTDSAGQSLWTSIVVTVANVPPTASLSAPASGNVGQSLSFTASATDPSSADTAAGFTYNWNFGDGSTATGSSPTHSYSATGTYTVSVTATDKDGGQGTASSTIIISPSFPSQGFHFDFGSSGSTVAAGYTQVTPATTYTQAQGYGWQDANRLYADSEWWPNYNPLTYDYNYGVDKTFLVDLPQGVYSVSPTMGDYRYPRDQISIWINGQQVASDLSSAAGVWLTPTYTIPITSGQMQLHLIDGGGVNPYFSINGLDVTYVSAWNGPTGYAGPATTANEGDSVSLARATASGGTAPLSYVWNFGDGTTEEGTLNPTHVYVNHGVYTATLTVTDANNLSSQSSTVVTINDLAPTVSVSVPSSGLMGSPISFLAAATSPSPVDQAAGFTYKWNFGDGTTGTGASPSHTYGAAGSYTVSATATDQDGATSVNAVATILISATISIDANWIQQHGPSPYYLDQAGATYQLQTDVTTNGTAFVALNNNINFDLNGHTITYDNSQPIVVPNGGFEDGSGPSDIPHWDLSQALAAQRVPAMTGMWGNWMLQLANISSTQILKSDTITIPQANVEYAAVVTPKSQQYDTTVTLSVVDAVTGVVLGSASSKAPDRGFGAVVQFVPTTTNPVTLQVTVTPASGKTDTVNLDYVSLTPSRNFGVVAAPWSTLPLNLQTDTVKAESGRVTSIVISNGSIVQGQARSFGGSGLYVRALSQGFSVNNVSVSSNGDDTSPIFGEFATNATVTNSQIQGNTLRITNRMLMFAGIDLQRTSGTIDIENNRISGQLQSGVEIGGFSSTTVNYKSIKINGNNISQESHWTDGYGIFLMNGLNNFEVANNTIVPVSGRGMMLASAGSTATTQNGVIHDNYVSVVEQPNLEYGTGFEPTAFRMRVYQTYKNIQVYNNTFIAHTGAGMPWEAIGGRITISNVNGENANSNNLFYNNTFKGILDSVDPTYTGMRASQALGLSLSEIEAGTGTQFLNNRFESNSTSLNLGDNDSYGLTNSDVLFVNNTLAKSAEGASVGYTGLLVGNWDNMVSNIRIIDMQYAGGAVPGATFAGNKAKDVEFGSQLRVTVVDAQGNPLAGANVSIQNQDGTQVFSGVTDEMGVIDGIRLLTTTLSVAAGGDNTKPVSTTKKTFTITGASGALSGSQTIELDGDAQVTLTLS